MSVLPETTWSRGVQGTKRPALKGDISADVAVMGAGLAGLLTAYLLAKSGKSVAVLESAHVGEGTTRFTTAFLTQSLDTDYSDLISAFGLAAAKKIAASHKDAIDLIEKIVKDEGIDCEFMRDSNYVYANSEKEAEDFKDMSVDLKKLGIGVQIHASGLGFANAGSLEMKHQAKFHPLKFLHALAEKAEAAGAVIYESTEALEAGGHSVKAAHGTVTAKRVVATTYAPFHEPFRLYLKKARYQSYVMEFGVTGMELQEGTFEDTENPYHYMRIDKEAGEGKFRVVIGGEDHRDDIHVNETKNFNALIDYTDTIIPSDKRVLREKWQGLMIEPVDGLPLIGTIKKPEDGAAGADEGILFATAFSGNGMTYSAIAAMIMADEIAGRTNPYAEVYAASRFPGFKALAIKGRDYGEEFISGAIKNTFTEPKEPKKAGAAPKKKNKKA